ncbi:GTP-binding protein [Parasphingopyxis sp.]|uniref:CobW family GTP-binding protein n=1 Tax=Parasphingopyxis sp. TaxID=1920299 RepID=UPI002639B607|nr:GTP-binding protein [Parasphingopyxis sp.]
MSAIRTGAQAPIPISLLTGFLGSGKTTLLNHLVQSPEMSKALLIINEFGSIGIDHDLVAFGDNDTVVEMSSGCLCCTIRGDLVRTLRDAPWRYARNGDCWFDRIVIETTGLADPMPILHALMTDEEIAPLYQLDSVITTVDAATGMDTLDRQEESVRQAAVADRLLLTKTDLVSESEAAQLKDRLRTINPAAPLITVINGEVETQQLFGAGLYDPATKSETVQAWLSAEAYEAPHHHHHDHDHTHDAHDHHHGEDEQCDEHDHGDAHDHHHDVNRHDDHIRSLCLTFDEPLEAEALERWLDILMMFASHDILRVKGILNLAGFDRPMVIHGVQNIFHPPVMLDAWPSDDHRSRIVFITRDIDERVLRETLVVLTQPISRFEVYGPEGSGLTGANPELLPLGSSSLDAKLTTPPSEWSKA